MGVVDVIGGYTISFEFIIRRAQHTADGQDVMPFTRLLREVKRVGGNRHDGAGRRTCCDGWNGKRFERDVPDDNDDDDDDSCAVHSAAADL